MQLSRTLILSILSLTLLVVLVACSSEPVAMDSVPVYPDSAPLAQGENTTADIFADTMQGMLGEQLAAEVDMYSLPADTTWEDVRAFYGSELTESDWEASEELNQENEVINTAGWTRGGLASEQVLIVGQGEDMLGGSPFLIVGLFSE